MARGLHLLLDTNVWLDYFLGNRPRNKETIDFLNKAQSCEAELLYSVTSSRDVAFFMESVLKNYSRQYNGGSLTEPAALAAKASAWACLEKLDELATAVGCDQSDIAFAHLQRHLHNSYEDNLVLAAAKRANADLLVTNDMKLIQHSPVPAMTTEDATRYIEIYAAQQQTNIAF